MPLRWIKVRAFGHGQSQAAHAFNGQDTNPQGIPNPAGTYFQQKLAADMPGCTVTINAAAYVDDTVGGTYMANTPLVRTFNSNQPSFWNDQTGTLDRYGNALVTYMQNPTRAATDTLAVIIHYMHSQDAAWSGWSSQLYADSLRSYYQALYAATAPYYGEVAILPVIVPLRSGSDPEHSRVGVMRTCYQALGNAGPSVYGLTPLPYVLRPHDPGFGLPVAAYDESSGDWTHQCRATAVNALLTGAHKIVEQNGIASPEIDQPRMFRARKIADDVCRLYFTSPRGHPLRRQGSGLAQFTLQGMTAAGISAIDNTNVATKKVATIDLTGCTFQAGARVIHKRWTQGGTQYQSRSVPRGQVQAAMWADPGGITTLTDAAEWVVLSGTIPMMTAPNELGVRVEM